MEWLIVESQALCQSSATPHANKSPLKTWENGERGRIQGLPQLFEVPPIISGMGKATNFKFCTHIHRIDRNKSPLKFWQK